MAPIFLHAIQASLGDCFLLQFEDDNNDKQSWMVDGGPGDWKMSDSYKRAANCLFGTINNLNIEKLQRLIVTHNDFDHTFGTYALLVSSLQTCYLSHLGIVLPTCSVKPARAKLRF